ncbi:MULTISPECIES: hypothetical protein [unclassified Bartonella]|uniref:hypothetical protein n=1 Tax=unclassified Bartonella TaxID=2645622 RepID=UPI0015FCCD90|nr:MULTISPECIES: hypothetical protein [unclassified Bartonella]UXN05283.1 hypothetical protein N6A79_08095 [Bartonella sp. HY761]
MNTAQQKDELDLLIEAWGGDVKALLNQLLLEREQLIYQVQMSANAMSSGFVRGWKPEVPVE